MAGPRTPQIDGDLVVPTGKIDPAGPAVDTMMDEVILARAESPTKMAPGAGVACATAMQQYLDTSPDIFKVKSGEYRGMSVPYTLRCGIFQSNIAEKAGLINKGEVTVRAVDFGNLMKQKGYHSEVFDHNKKYPDGTYIVGDGARDGSNSRHVAIICNGKLIHTSGGRVVNEPISNKFGPGRYDSQRVFIPPRAMKASEIDPRLLQA